MTSNPNQMTPEDSYGFVTYFSSVWDPGNAETFSQLHPPIVGPVFVDLHKKPPSYLIDSQSRGGIGCPSSPSVCLSILRCWCKLPGAWERRSRALICLRKKTHLGFYFGPNPKGFAHCLPALMYACPCIWLRAHEMGPTYYAPAHNNHLSSVRSRDQRR